MGTLVTFTHSKGTKVDSERSRAVLANESKSDLIISLGLDRHNNKLANGVATYFFGHEFSRSATGMRLADLIQEEITSHTSLADARSHAKTWDLLRMTKMPSVWVELGYATNPEDSGVLASGESRDAIAAALSSAITRLLAPRIA